MLAKGLKRDGGELPGRGQAVQEAERLKGVTIVPQFRTGFAVLRVVPLGVSPELDDQLVDRQLVGRAVAGAGRAGYSAGPLGDHTGILAVGLDAPVGAEVQVLGAAAEAGDRDDGLVARAVLAIGGNADGAGHG